MESFDAEAALAERVKPVRSIAWFLALGAVGITPLGFVLRSDVSAAPASAMGPVFVLLAVVELLFAHYLPQIMVAQAQRGVERGTIGRSDAIGSAVSIALVRVAFAEVPALLAFVLNVVHVGLVWVLALLALSAAMFVLYFPRFEQVREWFEAIASQPAPPESAPPSGDM